MRNEELYAKQLYFMVFLKVETSSALWVAAGLQTKIYGKGGVPHLKVEAEAENMGMLVVDATNVATNGVEANRLNELQLLTPATTSMVSLALATHNS